MTAAKPKIVNIKFTMLATGEDGETVSKHGYLASLPKGVPIELQADFIGHAAKETALRILREHEIGEVQI